MPAELGTFHIIGIGGIGMSALARIFHKQGYRILGSDAYESELTRELSDEGKSLFREAMRQYQLSGRAFHRILKVARTIADLADEEEIAIAHLAEALQYRPKLADMGA